MKRLAVLIALIYSSAAAAQQPGLVLDRGIGSAIQRSNIGRIVFTSAAIPIGDLDESDFLVAYDLTKKSDLFFTLFLDRSLTNHQHDLVPELSVEDIHANGNFQFTFFVDGRQIYQENLHFNSGSAQQKDVETVIARPFINYRNAGRWWSESTWNRFLQNGGEMALSEGKHRLKLEVRPYVDINGLRVGGLIGAGEVELNVIAPTINPDTIRLSDIEPYEGLRPSAERLDSPKLRELKGWIDAGVFPGITSIVVVRNGELLLEEYFNGADRTTLHDTRSVGKSFASTLVGIAIGEGFLRSEEETLGELYDLSQFSNVSAAKGSTSLRDLLTMSSAFDGNDDEPESPGNEEKMYPTSDWVKFTLDLPMNPEKPVGQWEYFTAGVILLGDVVNTAVPGGLEAYAHRKLFEPLGITDYQWEYTPSHVVNTAGGLRMRSLDYAKYGQLYANGGHWNGLQIIPAEWVRRSFTRQRAITDREGEYYGYLFWNRTYEVGGREYETFYSAGNGGSKIFVFEDEPLVVVITATAYGASYGHSQVDRMMEEYILPAVVTVGQQGGQR